MLSMDASVVTRSTVGAAGAASPGADSSVDEGAGGAGLGMMWSSVESHRRTASGG